MKTMVKSLLNLTANDLMSRDVRAIPAEMPLRDAARLLLQNRIGGAPVVDTQGKCIGVFSSTDFLRLAQPRNKATPAASPPLPMSCPFLTKRTGPDGREQVLCTLPPGMCPVQVTQSSGGEEVVVCSQPHCVFADWQVVEVEKLPADEVRRFMTPDPVTVRPDTGLRALARMMIDAHIHRIIVVDEEQKPIGIVSSTDLLAALAYAGPTL